MDNQNELAALQEVQISAETVFQGALLDVKRDIVELPNGKPAKRELIRHVGAVAIVPLCEDGSVIVERQFRYPMNRVITEIPAGKLDSKEEDHLEAAKRELREETGITADRWTELGAMFPTPAYSDEIIWLYLAEGLHQTQQELDDDEFLQVKKVPLEQLLGEIMNGEIPDSKTQIALMKTARILGK